MKDLFVTDIVTSVGAITDFFQVASSEAREAKNGKGYLSLTLKDKTGSIEARVWDWKADEMPSPPVGAVVKVRGAADSYKGTMQLKLTQMREAAVGEYDIADFLPVTTCDRNDLQGVIAVRLLGIGDVRLRDVCVDAFDRYAKEFFESAAAKSNHHAYLGGLMEHTRNLMRLASAICDLYPTLDRDVMIAACLWHDIGKVEELSHETSIDYTLKGNVLGHIPMGYSILEDVAQTLDGKLLHLAHIILSHHGRKEWGAPIEPKSPEAHIFHMLDMIDSRMGVFAGLKDEKLDENGMTGWIKSMGGPVWFPARAAALAGGGE